MKKIGARVVFKNKVNLLDCDWLGGLFTFAGLNLSDPKERVILPLWNLLYGKLLVTWHMLY